MTTTTTTMAPARANGSGNQQPPAGSKDMQFTPHGSDQPIKLNVNIVRTLCAAKTKSGKLPTEDDALKFMMLCCARRLNPFEGDAYLVGYDSQDGPTFSMITAHQAFLKRAECHAEFDGLVSGVVVDDGQGNAVDREGDFTFENETILGGWAKVYFKTRKHPMYKRLAYRARAKPNDFWKRDPAGMICKCAEADALRSAFPTLLSGMFLAEEREVQFVPQSSPTPIEPKPGTRQKFGTRRGTQPETPPEPADQEAAEQPPEADPADQADDIEATDAALRLAESLEAAIAEATTKAGLQTVGADLKAIEVKLGDRYGPLMAQWQRRWADLGKAK